ncbi:MAG: hypothetical protein RM368_02585 [Nostoc sp. DedSLP03]|uniref:hypothetical protein n=1 Tax=Nostoc sp. DedSLP03 TaxID=3075400 RepID=UPI002AD56C52|nr:hypothetical protein [Nostoc sp. DedSLP03]MDZ7963851.1 hypothetical protein [Nostoc sp. DedSLP03]
MKVDGNGQGKILRKDELRRLFTEGFLTPRDRALFGICLFTGCRVSEALVLLMTDIKSGTITFQKCTTKGKYKTRINRDFDELQFGSVTATILIQQLLRQQMKLILQ